MERANNFWAANEGRILRIFMANGFKFEGRLESTYQDFLRILDFKLGHSKILRISQIQDVEVME